MIVSPICGVIVISNLERIEQGAALLPAFNHQHLLRNSSKDVIEWGRHPQHLPKSQFSDGC
jgi:hypothetical protein